MNHVGGFLSRQVELVTVRNSGEHKLQPSVSALSALNAVQAVAWKVNTPVLEVAQAAYDSDDRLGGILPDPERLTMARLSDAAFQALDKTARQQLQRKRELLQVAADKRQAHRLELGNTLAAARDVAAEPAIYFVHRFDFRSRMYAVSLGISPQGGDLAKGLLRLAAEERLSDDGQYWLAVGLANLAGQDKVPYAERVAWVQHHRELILDSARSPLDGARFWMQYADGVPFLPLHDALLVPAPATGRTQYNMVRAFKAVAQVDLPMSCHPLAKAYSQGGYDLIQNPFGPVKPLVAAGQPVDPLGWVAGQLSPAVA